MKKLIPPKHQHAYSHRNLRSVEEVNALLAAAGDAPAALDFRDVITLVLNTGLRVRELCDLRWDDVDLVSRYIFVRRTKSFERRIPFGSKVLRILQARRERRNESDFVLGTSPQAVIRRVSGQLRKLSVKTLVRSLPLHVLRPFFAARLVSSGVGIESLMFVLGYPQNHLCVKSHLTHYQRSEHAVRDLTLVKEQE